MSGISTSLNALLATNFSDLGRIGQGVNGAFKATHPQAAEFKNQLGNLKEGTTVSARYDYRVGANGQLVPTGSSVTTRRIGEEEENQQRQRTATQDDRKQSFSDITKPKAQLLPSDELAIFAGAIEDDAEAAGQPIIILGGAEEEDGTEIDIELITPELGENAAPAQSLAAQRQQQVSSLYARNNDLMYTEFPVIQFAA